MIRRTAAALALASTLSIPVAAHAATDAGDTDGGVVDPSCTVTQETRAGETCKVCEFTDSDMVCLAQLGSQYNFACQASATSEVWCDGPSRVRSQPQGCAFGGGPAPAGGALLAALAGVAVWAGRRRRAK